jgi:hypothetical protein
MTKWRGDARQNYSTATTARRLKKSPLAERDQTGTKYAAAS